MSRLTLKDLKEAMNTDDLKTFIARETDIDIDRLIEDTKNGNILPHRLGTGAPADSINSNTHKTTTNDKYGGMFAPFPCENKRPLEKKKTPPTPRHIAPRSYISSPPISPEHQISHINSSLCNNAQYIKSCEFINKVLLRGPHGMEALRWIFYESGKSWKGNWPDIELEIPSGRKLVGRKFQELKNDLDKIEQKYFGEYIGPMEQKFKQPEVPLSKMPVIENPPDPMTELEWLRAKRPEPGYEIEWSKTAKIIYPEKKSADRKRSYNIEHPALDDSAPPPAAEEPPKCKACDGEGYEKERCPGDCYIEGHKLCNGNETGECRDGHQKCQACDGTGEQPEEE